MSSMRPSLRDGGTSPCPTNGTAYLMIYNAVKQSDGLLWGQLHDQKGSHCALGWTFHNQSNIALPSDLIDEVAMVNDSVPKSASRRERRRVMLRWLRWKLQSLGMGGFGPLITPPQAKK